MNYIELRAFSKVDPRQPQPSCANALGKDSLTDRSTHNSRDGPGEEERSLGSSAGAPTYAHAVRSDCPRLCVRERRGIQRQFIAGR
jgi:hypothetical protein